LIKKRKQMKMKEEKKKEESLRMSHFGLASGNQDGESHLVGLLRCEKGAVLFKSPSSVLHAPLAQSPSPSTTLV